MTRTPHTLVVTDTGVGWQTYRIECPGVDDACRIWEAADCPESKFGDVYEHDTWFDYEGETVAHGVEHAYINGDWCHPTDRCWLVESPNLRDAVRDLRVGPGRHQVVHEYDCGGEGMFTLNLATAEAIR